MPGPRPQPSKLKMLRGNPGKRPLPQDEPQPASDLPSPPPHLKPAAKAEWHRIAGELHRIGVLTGVDRAILAGYCTLYARWVEAEEGVDELLTETVNGCLIQNPCIGIANRALELMHKYMVELGLTPSSRTRIKAVKPKEEDALESFLGGKKKGRG